MGVNKQVPAQYLSDMRALRQRIQDGESTWHEALALRDSYELPMVSIDTIRKGAFIYDEFNEAGWIAEPVKTNAQGSHLDEVVSNSQRFKETISMNKDGSQTSEKIIELEPGELADEKKILEAHSYDPVLFKLINAKNSIWQQGNKQGGIRHLYSSKITVVPRHDGLDLEDLKKHFEDFRSPVFNKGVKPFNGEGFGNAVFFGHYDTHFGRYASEYETGKEYGLESARKAMISTTKNFISGFRNQDIETIYYVVGQDFFNSSSTGFTTSQSHLQDNATTFNTLFKKGTEAIIECVDMMREIASVHIVFCSGNHSRFEEFALAQILEAYYKNTKSVTVDATPYPRKYIQYGVNCVGITHGSDEKDRIYGLMQSEASRMWADTSCHVWLTGHIHHNSLAIKENFGVSVFSLSALCHPDNWTVKSGYTMADSGCVAFTFSKTKGLKGINFYNVDME